MKVNFLDLKYTTNQIKGEYLKRVGKILDNANYILTEEVTEFEEKYAKMFGTKYAVGLSCGADALYVGLEVCGIKEGDEVIVQGNAYNASVTSILRVGAIPVFVDIDTDTMCINVNKIEKVITDKTSAIMPIHLYGYPNNMKKISEIAKKHDLRIIEDCAQAHLSEYNGKKVGTFGDVGAFSFYPTKNLGAFGDAGAIITNDEDMYMKALSIRNLGQLNKNEHHYYGLNMRLDPVQAVALTLKLNYLEDNIKLRKRNAKYYNELFTKSGIDIKIPQYNKINRHVYHLYVIQLPEEVDRTKLQEKLIEKGIPTAIHYPVPVYRQTFFDSKVEIKCPNTEKVCSNILSLPMHENITKNEQEYVVENVIELIKGYE